MKCYLIMLLFFLPFAFIGCGNKTPGGLRMSDRPIKNIEIEEAITLIRNEKHKKMLLNFKTSFSEGDSFIVTAHTSHFEIIVSHPSENDFTGGTEQYFLYKNTGRFKMGWHEHPMHLPKSTKIDEDVH